LRKLCLASLRCSAGDETLLMGELGSEDCDSPERPRVKREGRIDIVVAAAAAAARDGGFFVLSLGVGRGGGGPAALFLRRKGWGVESGW
jgi:hypothetical protein